MFSKKSAKNFLILLIILTEKFAVAETEVAGHTNEGNKTLFKTEGNHINNLFKKIHDSNRQHESKWGYHLIRNLSLSADIFRSGNNKENGYLRTLVPLWMDKQQKVLFFAPGLTYYQKRLTYNAGLGFRHLNSDKNFIWGINVFYDYDSKGKNRRLSEGLELNWRYLKLFGNWYQGLTKWHESPDDAGRQEKPADGFDMKMRFTLPVYPQLSLSANYFSWKDRGVNLYKDNVYRNSPHGFIYSIEYRPVPLIGLSVSRAVATKKSNKTSLTATLNITYDFSRSLRRQTHFSWKPAKAILREQLFSQVEREYGIVLNTHSQMPEILLPSVFAVYANQFVTLSPHIENKGHRTNGYQWSSPVLSLSNENRSELRLIAPSYISEGNNHYPVTLTVFYESGETVSANTVLVVQPAIQNVIFDKEQSVDITKDENVLEKGIITDDIISSVNEIPVTMPPPAPPPPSVPVTSQTTVSTESNYLPANRQNHDNFLQAIQDCKTNLKESTTAVHQTQSTAAHQEGNAGEEDYVKFFMNAPKFQARTKLFQRTDSYDERDADTNEQLTTAAKIKKQMEDENRTMYLRNLSVEQRSKMYSNSNSVKPGGTPKVPPPPPQVKKEQQPPTALQHKQCNTEPPATLKTQIDNALHTMKNKKGNDFQRSISQRIKQHKKINPKPLGMIRMFNTNILDNLFDRTSERVTKTTSSVSNSGGFTDDDNTLNSPE